MTRFDYVKEKIEKMGLDPHLTKVSYRDFWEIGFETQYGVYTLYVRNPDLGVISYEYIDYSLFGESKKSGKEMLLADSKFGATADLLSLIGILNVAYDQILKEL